LLWRPLFLCGSGIDKRTYQAKVRFADDTAVADVRWLASDGQLAIDGQVATWTVEAPLDPSDGPAPEAIAADIEALVSDGKGGYALLVVTFPADVPRQPTGGVTTDGGAPLSGASVTLGTLSTTTNDDGLFVLPKDSWSAESPMRISAPGHVDRVLYTGSPQRGAALPLRACEVVTFEAKVGGIVSLPSDPDALSITIPAGSAQLTPGQPFIGNVSACMAALDPAEGDWSLGTLTTKADASGSVVGFAPGAGAWLDFRDAADPSRRITFNKPVQVSLRAPGAMANLAVWTPAAGDFVNVGETIATGGVIRTELTGTVALTPMTPNPMTCVRLYLDGLLHRGDYLLRYRIVEPGVTHHWQFQLVVPGVERLGPLPANRNVEIEVVDMRTSSPNGAAVTAWTRVIATGPDPLKNILTQNAFPYESCGNEVVLPPEAPSTGVDFLSRFVPDLTGIPATTFTSHGVDYAVAAGFPEFQRSTLFDNVGFDRSVPRGPWPATALYRNVFDLGFVRRIIFKESLVPTGTRTAIAVENDLQFGTMLNENASPINAVVMVATPPSLGAEPVVIFRVVNGAGPGLETMVNLDGGGFKPVPYVCMSCHGGDYLGQGLQPWPEHADIGARFLPFAPDQFEFPTAADAVLRPHLSTTWTRAAQEPGLRRMNEALLKTGVGPATRRMIHGHYGSNDPSGDTLPVVTFDDSWVPPGGDSQGWGDRPDLYREVTSAFCRSCHQSFDHIDFGTFDGFGRYAGLIEQQVCVNRTMPHSALTYDKFWTSSNPYAPAFMNRAMSGTPGWSGTLCP